MKKLLFILLLSASSLRAMGYFHKQINVANGLSNNQVLCLASDNEGYIWVGTEAGLNRIAAGVCTRMHRPEQWYHGTRGDSEKVVSLHYDAPSSTLFVGTESGLDIVDSRTGAYRLNILGDSLLNFSVQDIAIDHRGGVWLFYDNGQVQHLDCADLKVATSPVRFEKGCRSGLDDGKGHLYIGHSKGGMSIVDYSTGKTKAAFVHEHGNSRSIPGDNVRRILQDSHGRIWVGTDHGLALFNPAAATFQEVRHADTPYDDNVFDLMEMNDGRLLVAMDVGGIGIVDSRTLGYTDDAPVELSSLNTRCLLQDRHGNVWVGSHSTGIDFLSDKEALFHQLPYRNTSGRRQAVNAITADGQGRLWVNGEDELSLWQDATCLGAWPISGLRNRAHSFARTMMADHKGRVWMGMEDEGVIRFDPHTQRFERIDIGYDAPDIHSFFEDDDGSVWIGSQFGICVYHDGIVSHADNIDDITRKAPVTSFIRFGKVMLMATQGNGVVLYNTDTGTSRQLHMADGLPTENINQALPDGNGGVWLATNKGIVLLSDITGGAKVLCFDDRQGLADNQVQAIAIDRQGRLWASTFTCISCLDHSAERGLLPAASANDKEWHCHNFTGHAQVSTGGFVAGSVAQTADGQIAFGSSGGVCFVRPDLYVVGYEAVQPKIAICNIYQPTAEGTATIGLFPGTDGRIELTHRQNTLQIVATVDNYAQWDFVDMAYKMKGLEDKWYDMNDMMEVSFRSLPPGRYTFLLRAKLKNQNWDSASETKLAIVIAPPFWLSWWAWLIYAIAAVGTLWYMSKAYKRHLALQNSLELARREGIQKQELNEERLRFFTNITHELRTPLTLILGPLEDLAADSTLSTGSRRKVELINRSAGRLRDLINQILEFRKTETQNRRLTVAKGDIGQFVREMVLNYKELNRNSNVEIRYRQQGNLPAVYFDSEVVSTVVNNLLSNAMKYTEKGSIDVAVETNDEQQLLIRVADTGHGISAEALPHIFDRYYQAKGEHQASGTGIGLALVKALADLHEAQISVQSQEGRGCEFTLALSVHNTYPNALHKEDAHTDTPTLKTEKHNEGEPAEEERPQLLIVEDNDDIRQYIVEALCNDYRILEARNGLEGAALANEHLPDLIVSDIMMPQMNGIQMTHQLKDSLQTSHIPIILLTAKDTDEDKEEGYDSGADSYLTKPFTAKLLISRIRNLLANRRRLAEQLSSNGVESIAVDLSSPQNTLSRLDHDFLVRLDAIVQEHIMKTDIDMGFLTDKMAMSHSTFYRKIKALTGLTAQEYVRKQRLRHCYKLLQSGDYNVTEAAMMTGFNQMAHFREVFKKEFGVLPSEVAKKGTGE